MRLYRSMRRHWECANRRDRRGHDRGGGRAVRVLPFHRGPSSAPLSLSSESSTSVPSRAAASPTTTAAVDGVWHVTSGSQAGYRVQETLFGQSHTAVGRTHAVTGSLTISATSVTTAQLSVDLTKVTSDESLHDEQFQGRIMDTAMYPTATFALTQPIDLGSVPAEGVEITEQATGTLSMHGVTRAVGFISQPGDQAT